MHKNIFIFGDSIGFGSYDPAGGWAQRLNSFLMERYLEGKGEEFFVYNLSASSGTTVDILERCKKESSLRIPFKESVIQNIVIFAMGVNDSAYVHSEAGHWVGLEKFKSNLSQLTWEVKEIFPAIVFVGLAPVDDAIVDPFRDDTDVSYRNKDILEYDRLIREFSRQKSFLYIPIFDKMAKDCENLLHDGLHPNSAGHQMIFEIVRDFLVENEII